MQDPSYGSNGSGRPGFDWNALPELVRKLARHIARACDLAREDLLALDEQLLRLAATSGTATMIDVEVPADAPRLTLADGPLPIRAFVIDSAGDAVGEVLVWMRGGVLRGIEQAWWTDRPPSTWPSLDMIELK